MEIYYFSGTGNSLHVAKTLARKTDGVLCSVASVVCEQSIQPKADSIGIVFPCYLAQLNGVPLVVEKFVQKLEGIEDKYIFAVCTCGGYTCVDALPALERLAFLIHSVGGKLSAAFSLRLPMNNLQYYFFQTHHHEKMFQKSEKEMERICKCVVNRQPSKYYLSKKLFNYLMMPLYLVLRNFFIIDLKLKAKEPKKTQKKFFELIPLTDRSIAVDQRCNGCSICAKVCPVRNIVMEKSRPVWQNHCEMCMACSAWCPQGAIHHWNMKEEKRYLHPDVTISDMLTQSRMRP
jgi:ferredoxin